MAAGSVDNGIITSAITTTQRGVLWESLTSYVLTGVRLSRLKSCRADTPSSSLFSFPLFDLAKHPIISFIIAMLMASSLPRDLPHHPRPFWATLRVTCRWTQNPFPIRINTEIRVALPVCLNPSVAPLEYWFTHAGRWGDEGGERRGRLLCLDAAAVDQEKHISSGLVPLSLKWWQLEFWIAFRPADVSTLASERGMLHPWKMAHHLCTQDKDKSRVISSYYSSEDAWVTFWISFRSEKSVIAACRTHKIWLCPHVGFCFIEDVYIVLDPCK